MKAITWIPGTNAELDELFDSLREEQYNNKSHRLWKNYSKDEIEKWSGSIAYTICFDNNNVPEMCSTISERSCWPKGAYRILNRLWKANNKIQYPKVMSPSFAESAKSQISWLEKNINYQLYFISRQTDNWEDFALKSFASYGVNFQKDKYYYLTCPNECDDTCWQKILYSGNQNILNSWKKRP